VPQQVPSPEERLRELGIELPEPAVPVANYVTRVQVGDFLFTSGHGSDHQGKVGEDMTLEEGYEAARATGLRVLATTRDALGSLDRVVRVVQIIGMVNCTPDFTQQPQVINGFSDLLVEVFGEETGRGARAAVGMVSLPSGIPVEIMTTFQVRA
jgi:enamine deaminase RidA (YjgF/YER057c/UK114 family)